MDNMRNGAMSNSKVFIRQLPADVDWDSLEDICRSFGELDIFEKTGTPEHPTATVTYQSVEDASSSIPQLSDTEFPQGSGLKLKVSYYQADRANRAQRGRGVNIRRDGDMAGGRPNAQDLPLRMVVDARFVGAIIGQGGQNIREITKESKARCVVDVNRGLRDQAGNMEKVINIYGQPENCSKACIRIMEVVQRESAKENNGTPPEPELKLRAHNQLVGRLIGKGGTTIKKIMEDTNCTIFVSNGEGGDRRGGDAVVAGMRPALYNPSISELSAYNMERTITVRGTVDNIAKAEERISSKLRQCWQNDWMNQPEDGLLQPVQSMNAYGGGVHPLVPQSGFHPAGDPYAQFAPNGAPIAYNGQQSQGGRPGPQQPPIINEVVHMWVPNNIVGALIGTKGVHIRNVMRLTGAHIRIEGGGRSDEQQMNNNNRGDSRAKPIDNEERLVTITGTDQQQYKAQFWIYQRICENGYHFFDEVRLCTEVAVPTKLVGRIIGKGGQNVRELQRFTGAQVKIPEDAASEDTEETIVRVIGNFQASQAVQARTRQLVQQFTMQQMRGE